MCRKKRKKERKKEELKRTDGPFSLIIHRLDVSWIGSIIRFNSSVIGSIVNRVGGEERKRETESARARPMEQASCCNQTNPESAESASRWLIWPWSHPDSPGGAAKATVTSLLRSLAECGETIRLICWYGRREVASKNPNPSSLRPSFFSPAPLNLRWWLSLPMRVFLGLPRPVESDRTQ